MAKKFAEIIYSLPCNGYFYYLCSYINSRGRPMYGLCPSKKVFEVGARAPIGFIKRGDEYKMYIRKEDK